jgi:anaerobic sulfite reductase subunit C
MRPGTAEESRPSSHTAHRPAFGAAPAPLAEVDIRPCRAARGCPNAVGEVAAAVAQVSQVLTELGAASLVREKAGRSGGPLLAHHQLKVSLSGCANCCSQPQIADAGLVAQLRPMVDRELCDGCGACVASCREDALFFDHDDKVVVDRDQCLSCGVCVRVCPNGAMGGEPGWRVLAGGRLGRHPRLAVEIGTGVSLEQGCELVGRVIRTWGAHGRPGERVGVTLERLAGAGPVGEMLRQAGRTGG